MKIEDQGVEDRMAYLDDKAIRKLLGRVVGLLIRDGHAVTAADLLFNHCLLTKEEADRIHDAYHKRGARP